MDKSLKIALGSLGVVIIGALIIAAALTILHEAYGGFLAPRAIDALWTGLTIGMVATILNAGWGVPSPC